MYISCLVTITQALLSLGSDDHLLVVRRYYYYSRMTNNGLIECLTLEMTSAQQTTRRGNY